MAKRKRLILIDFSLIILSLPGRRFAPNTGGYWLWWRFCPAGIGGRFTVGPRAGSGILNEGLFFSYCINRAYNKGKGAR